MQRDLKAAAAEAAKQVATVDAMWARMQLGGGGGGGGGERAAPERRAGRERGTRAGARAVASIHSTQQMVADSLRKAREQGLVVTPPAGKPGGGGAAPS